MLLTSHSHLLDYKWRIVVVDFLVKVKEGVDVEEMKGDEDEEVKNELYEAKVEVKEVKKE